jgi:hypothetical protein
MVQGAKRNGGTDLATPRGRMPRTEPQTKSISTPIQQLLRQREATLVAVASLGF